MDSFLLALVQHVASMLMNATRDLTMGDNAFYIVDTLPSDAEINTIKKTYVSYTCKQYDHPVVWCPAFKIACKYANENIESAKLFYTLTFLKHFTLDTMVINNQTVTYVTR